MQDLESILVAKGFDLVQFDDMESKTALFPNQYRRKQIDTVSGPVLVLLWLEAEGAPPIQCLTPLSGLS